jgi:putative oxidoreductase
MNGTLRPYVELLARVVLSSIFLFSGFGKVTDWSGTAEHMAGEGMVAVPLLLAGAIAVELGAGTALLTGCWTRAAALALIVFLIPTTVIFHDFWAFEGMARQNQMFHFLKNVALIGGLLKFAADGAGRFSFDARGAKAETAAAAPRPEDRRVLVG